MPDEYNEHLAGLFEEAEADIGETQSALDPGDNQPVSQEIKQTRKEIHAAKVQAAKAQAEVNQALGEADGTLEPKPGLVERVKTGTKTFVDEVKKQDLDITDFGVSNPAATAEDKAIAEDLQAAQLEIERDPSRAKNVLASMGADALLMRRIIENRSGLKGKIARFIENTNITLGKKNINLATVVGTGAGAVLLNTALHLTKLAAPGVGAITGGVIGGFFGYARGKRQTESAERWKQDLDLVGRNRESIEKMSYDELEIAIGVIDNAVRSDRVRGGTEELVGLMRTYRIVKDCAAEKLKARVTETPEAVTDVEGLDIDRKLALEEDIGNKIAAAANEKYKGLYKGMISGKDSQVLGSVFKGAFVGASIGGILGFASQWVAGKLGAAHAAHGQESQIKEHIDAFRQTDAWTGHEQHASIVNQAQQVQAGASASPEQALLFQQHADIIQHSNNIIAQHGRIEGFAQQGIDQLGQHLNSNPSYWNLVKEAGLNNIDLTATTSNGQTLGNFLIAHKDAFMQLTPELQRQALSYPSLAAEIIAGTTATTAGVSAATVTAISAAAIGAVGLGGFILGSVGKTEVGEAYDKAHDKADTDRKTEGETIAAKIKALDKKETESAGGEEENRLTGVEANIAAAKTELIGKEIWIADYPNRLYKVTAIDAEGQLGFVYTEEDKEKLKSDEESELPHPDVNISDLVNENGNLDSSKVRITSSEARVERRPAGKTQTAELEGLKSSGDFVKVTLEKVMGKVGPKDDRRDREFWTIRLASGTVVTIEPKNAGVVCAGKKAGDKIEVKIDGVQPKRHREQDVYNVTLSLKPKEEPKPEPDKSGGPKPAEDRAKQMEAYFSPEGVIDEDNLDTMDEAVGEFAATMTDPKKKAPRVVVSKPDGSEFYMLVAVADEKYTAYPYDTLNQKPDLSKKTEVFARDLTNGWKLFVGKGGSENE